MFPIPLIHAKATDAGLRYLVIGGHAMNAYCAPRATLDVDLLVRRRDLEAWRDLIIGEGFQVFQEAENFAQFSPPYGTTWRLDLMLVNDATFERLDAAAQAFSCLGMTTRVASVPHLIALKLHAARHGPAAWLARDLADIVNLMRAGGHGLESPEMREMLAQHGSPELHEKLRQLAAP